MTFVTSSMYIAWPAGDRSPYSSRRPGMPIQVATVGSRSARVSTHSSAIRSIAVGVRGVGVRGVMMASLVITRAYDRV